MAVLPGDSAADFDAHCTQNMDFETAELERLWDELMVIAAVLGLAVDGSFGKVQGLDLCRCRS